MNERMNSLKWTLISLAPGGTQNSEFVCLQIVFQTIAQMVMVVLTTLNLMSE